MNIDFQKIYYLFVKLKLKILKNQYLKKIMINYLNQNKKYQMKNIIVYYVMKILKRKNLYFAINAKKFFIKNAWKYGQKRENHKNKNQNVHIVKMNYHQKNGDINQIMKKVE